MSDNYTPPDNTDPPSHPDNGQMGVGRGSPSQPSPSSERVAVNLPEVSPMVAYVIMGITILVFLLQFSSEYLYGIDYPVIQGAKINDLILQGQFWRLITPVLLHGSILHLGFNMYALYVLGPGLERFYGHGRFLILYLLAGFAGNVMSFLFTPAPSLGASTAIFGLLGAQGVFLYQNREIFGRPVQRALGNLIMIAVINLLFGLSPGIDNWGHIGGLIGGTLFAWYAGPLLKLQGVFPALALVDERSTGEILRTGLSVGLLFGSLAAVTIFLRV